MEINEPELKNSRIPQPMEVNERVEESMGSRRVGIMHKYITITSEPIYKFPTVFCTQCSNTANTIM